MSDVEICGTCDHGFEKVRAAFAGNFAKNLECGASFALIKDGRLLVDLWAGQAGPGDVGPWQRDTLVSVNSSAKVPVTLCALKLVDDGRLDLDAPIATYWPEFAAKGKQSTLVRHILSHSTGVPGLDGCLPFSQFASHRRIAEALAAEESWWTPGEKTAYHSFTYGPLLGEVMARITGQSLKEFFESEFADPHGIDFHFGMDPSIQDRFALMDRPEEEEGLSQELPPDSVVYRLIGYYVDPKHENFEADLPKLIPYSENCSSNGVANARALAEIGSILVTGRSKNGTVLLNPETLRLPYQEQSYRFDLNFCAKVRYGHGFGLVSKEIPLPWPKAFHWGGFGGSSVVMVPEEKMAFAYTPCKFYQGRSAFDLRGQAMKDAVIETLCE